MSWWIWIVMVNLDITYMTLLLRKVQWNSVVHNNDLFPAVNAKTQEVQKIRPQHFTFSYPITVVKRKYWALFIEWAIINIYES